MKLRLLFASAVTSLLVGTTAMAQVAFSGITVTPVGATADQEITITVNPNQTCPTAAADPNKTLATSTFVRMHGGVRIDGANWQNVVEAINNSEPTNITGFTLENGVWIKRLTPRIYFNITDPLTRIDAITFVLNGGPEGNMWDREGKGCNADGTNGSGGDGDLMIRFPVPSQISSVRVGDSIIVASTAGKLQAAKLFGSVQPNPFAGSTSLKYNLTSNENVSIKVYNAIGVEVATLTEGTQTAGNHAITWNAANASKGIYLVRIVAGNKTDSRRLVKID